MSQKFEVELEDETVNDLTQQAQNLSDSYNQRRQEEANRREQVEEEQQQQQNCSVVRAKRSYQLISMGLGTTSNWLVVPFLAERLKE